MLRRVSKIENGSGLKSINLPQPCYLGRVNWWHCFMVVLLPFLLFCSSWMDSALHRHLFKTAENLNYSPSSCSWFLSVLSLSQLRLILVKLALSVCTTGAERLLQLNFMLSRTSDMCLLKTQTIKSSVFSSFSLSLLSAPFRLSFQRSAALIRLLEWRHSYFLTEASVVPTTSLQHSFPSNLCWIITSRDPLCWSSFFYFLSLLNSW